jgi:hypothetical protein
MNPPNQVMLMTLVVLMAASDDDDSGDADVTAVGSGAAAT